MSDPEVALLEIEDPYVLEEQEVHFDFPLGRLVVEDQAGGPSVRVIAVAEFEQKVLVCVPLGAWHKKVASRALPGGSLQKAARLEVAACALEDRSVAVDGEMMKVWMGFFTKTFAENVIFTPFEEEVSVDFEANMLPFAEALRDLSTEHFAFFSAGEQQGQPLVGEGSGSDPLGSRVTMLENMLDEVNKNIGILLSRETGLDKETPRKSALRHPKAKPKERAAIPRGSGVPVEDYPDLDPGVVAAARQAGVESVVLGEMQDLVASGRKGAKPLKQVTLPKNLNALSESEEDEGQEPGLEEVESTGSVALALTKLTAIVDHLSSAKKSNRKTSPLEQALDGVSFTAGDTGLLGGGKRSAAARRALKASLVDSPEELYQLIERLMEEDIASQSLVPGATSHTTSARTWMEHRSRIGQYRAVAHCGWGIAGIVDSLRAGHVKAARARANVLLLQIDQSCVDKGSWTLAADLALEPPPPFANLALHRAPDVVSGELPYSRLLDPRWAELALNHLKEQDDYLARRRNLGKTKGLANSEGNEDPAAGSEDPKRRPRPKAKAKASAEAQ